MNGKYRLIASACAVSVLLTGCDKKAEGQVVAVVNGEEVTQQELNAELQGANVPPNVDKKQFMAQLLQRVVERKLLVQKAKAEGLDQSPAYLEQIRRQQDALIINLLGEKVAKGIPLPDAAAVDKFMSGNPTLFSERKRYLLDQIVFDPPKDASVMKKLEPAHTMDAVAAALSASGVQFKRGSRGLDSAAIPPALATRINSLPPGEPFIIPENGRFVVNVIKSAEVVPTPEQQAKPAALQVLRQQALAEAMQKQLKAARDAAKIEYQPGFEPPKTPASTAPSQGDAVKGSASPKS